MQRRVTPVRCEPVYIYTHSQAPQERLAWQQLLGKMSMCLWLLPFVRPSRACWAHIPPKPATSQEGPGAECWFRSVHSCIRRDCARPCNSSGRFPGMPAATGLPSHALATRICWRVGQDFSSLSEWPASPVVVLCLFLFCLFVFWVGELKRPDTLQTPFRAPTPTCGVAPHSGLPANSGQVPGRRDLQQNKSLSADEFLAACMQPSPRLIQRAVRLRGVTCVAC